MNDIIQFPTPDGFTPISKLVKVRQPVPVPMAEPIHVDITDVCRTCKGAGWLRYDVPYGHPNFGKLIKCHCKERELVATGQAKTYTWLGLAEDDLGEKTFESFTRRDLAYQRLAHDKARGYASMFVSRPDGQSNVVFKGSVGTGKTHLACAILNFARENGIPCLFATAPEFFNALYSADFDEKEALITQASGTPLLCLDDIDKLHIRASNDPDMPSGSYQKGVLFDVLNRRYRAHRPTILTTNAQNGFDRWLDEATQDRLLSLALNINMVGTSQRREG